MCRRPGTWRNGCVTTYAAAPGPTAIAERALGPDLARGVMLLAIALANSHYFLQGSSVLGGYPQDGSDLDRGVTWLLATFVDGRAFPMFALLFGYGVARIAARRSGPAKATRRLLWRRAAVLIAVGFVDALALLRRRHPGRCTACCCWSVPGPCAGGTAGCSGSRRRSSC